MDCGAIVLSKLLSERSLEIWSKLKLVFLDPAFSSLYSAIAKYYDNYSTVPSFDELELTLREGPALRTLATVKLADNPDISAEVASASQDRDFDIIIANVNRHIIEANMVELSQVSNSNSTLILSGLLIEDQKDMINLAIQNNWKFIQEQPLNGWVSMLFKKA